ncbi:hypothetical protein ACTMTU_09085 [Streptomyces sp. OZ13]|uniref:hypothetical protein n=1 Tax=Streptomyces sp. OZ13 TaxID=3452210 RepID=UPI003F889DB1
MNERIGMEPLRRLPWNSPEDKPAYVALGDGVINQVADSVETDTLRAARADAGCALALAGQPEASQAELRAGLRALANVTLAAVAVAELRGERLDAPAAVALNEALREAFRR